MLPASGTVYWAMTNLIGVTIMLAYTVLVIMGYVTEGPQYRLNLDPDHPGRTAQRLLVGIGVRFAAAPMRAFQLILDPLFEASAEVGDWVTAHASPEAQARYRTRFL